jgi:Family of unknown function (DUF6527)
MLLASARRLLTTTHARLASAVTRLLWFRPPPGPTHQISRVIRLSRRSDLPRRLHPQRLYLIGTPEKWAIFRCPCGTGHQIDLNLAHPGRPRWSVTLDPERRPSLRPSIDVRATRRCHFWLTNGQVRWCQDTR